MLLRVELVNEQIIKLQLHTGVQCIWLANAGFIPNCKPVCLDLLILYSSCGKWELCTLGTHESLERLSLGLQ
jgi:hypothetical protein